MNTWDKIKAHVVGLHAAWLTGYNPIKRVWPADEKAKEEAEVVEEKARSQPEEPEAKSSRPVFSDSEGLYDYVKNREQLGIRRTTSMREPNPNRTDKYLGPWLGRGAQPVGILSALQREGWTNLVVLNYPNQGLVVEGNRGAEYGKYEATVNTKGELLSVKTLEAITYYTPESELPEIAEEEVYETV